MPVITLQDKKLIRLYNVQVSFYKCIYLLRDKKYMASKKSIRTRFIFEQLPVRGVQVQLNELWQEIRKQKDYPEPVEQILGQLLAAGILLSSNLKQNGKLILQIQGTGILNLAVVEVTSDLTCRATARWQGFEPDQMSDHSLMTLAGKNAQFVMTVQPDDGSPWQGIIAITEQCIAKMLMDYMSLSEQLPTYLYLHCTDTSAAGLMLQRLPEGTIHLTEQTEDQWHTLTTLSETISADELHNLDTKTLLHRLFHEYDLRLFEAENFEFACTCSREKVADMLKLIGFEEASKTLEEQGSIEIGCDFCQRKYVFDDDDIEELFELNESNSLENTSQQNIHH